MRKFLSAILITITLVCVSCDKAVENKYLSGKLKDSSVTALTDPTTEEPYIPVIPKSKEQEFLIPDAFKQKVSLSINDGLPIKSVLYETAKKLNIDFQMDPSINSRIIFSARGKPFIEILDAVCELANLRYSINGNNFISVVHDVPYTATYDLQFLNFSRDSENKISIATEVSSGATHVAESGSGAKTQQAVGSSSASDSSVTVKTKNDFWGELDNGIKVILNGLKDCCYSINKQAGIVTVCASSKQQRSIKNYIELIKETTESQVLIEAKIIEIALKNEYQRGIDWSILGKELKIQNSSQVNTKASGFSGTLGSAHMTTILKVLEEFGSMRTISNPRITAMNNQAAVLKVAENHVYFKLNYDKTYAATESGRDYTSVSSDIKTVPIGLVMFVQPSINVNEGSITLFLRPTISKLSGTVTDPAVDIAIRSMDQKNQEAYEPSKIPVTEVREVTSVLKLNDGEIAILGGFMEVVSSKNKSGIPFFKDLPFIGEAASSNEMKDKVVELVILIKVKIISNTQRGRKNAADARLLKFVPDPRPF